ncbi:MAG: hypothetical protein HY706_02350 [Candidatus Hydrogenedentes bacterium]|nr:hypothetical protein [Candidatus Hydrogenedentota bacterium]
MNGIAIRRWLVGVAVVALLALVLYGTVQAICQHRAGYAGGLIFVGHRSGFFGTVYERVYVWRARGSTEPLPNVAVFFDDAPYALSVLTPDLVTSLGGALMSGSLDDREGHILRYRFEDGKLTWFSFEIADMRYRARITPNAKFKRIALSLNGGEAFSFPVSHRELVKSCGKPESFYYHFAQ